MAKVDFDFKALKELNLVKYLKAYCKPMQVRKAKAGIIFTDYHLKGKKTACIFLPFKKMVEANELFKVIKATKEHKLVKTALVIVDVDTKLNTIDLKIKKGSLGIDVLEAKGGDFFQNNFKLALKVGAELEPKQPSTTSDITKESVGAGVVSQPEEDVLKGKKLTATQRQKIKGNMKALQTRLDQIAAALKKAN